ncbi:hypothetical protein KY321_00180 [Candidatus Woesearchaeota archaeon]|nr:hypothetical protein [Candidatus Woesearchaeota archaeon]
MDPVFINEEKLELMVNIGASRISEDLGNKDVDEFLDLHRHNLDDYMKIFSSLQLRIYQDYDKNPGNYEFVESYMFGSHISIKVPLRIR